MRNRITLAIACGMMLVSLSCGGSKDGSKADGTNPEVNANGAYVANTDGTESCRPDTARVYYDGKVDPSKAFIVISKLNLQLSVYADMDGDTTLVARYPVCLSRNKGPKEKSGDMKTPESEPGKPFSISQIQDASDWTHDFGDGRGMILSYGHWFMRLATPFSGIGIHGSTNNEDKMPGRDSEGCIRMRDNDLVHFHDNYAHVGMPVIIKGERQGDLPFETRAQKQEAKPIK